MITDTALITLILKRSINFYYLPMFIVQQSPFSPSDNYSDNYSGPVKLSSSASNSINGTNSDISSTSKLVKQESNKRHHHHQLSSADLIAGCGSSPSVIDDDPDQDDCDTGISVDVTLNHHHHHHAFHHNVHNSLSGQSSVHNSMSGQANSHHTSTTSSHETLSVIVQPQDDSHDPDDSSSQLLSPSGKITPNSTEMIDTSDFRALHEPTYQTLTSVNGQMSPPGFSPNSSYATLTPLQPLPPISTMSDKFSYGHSSNASGSFAVMPNNNMGIGLGMNVNSPYSYDKLPSMGMSPPHNYSSPTNTLGGITGNSVSLMSPHKQKEHLLKQKDHSVPFACVNVPFACTMDDAPLSPQSSYSQNGLHSPQKSMSPNGYDSPYGDHRDLLNSVGASANDRQTLQSHSPTLSPQSVSLHSPGASGSGGNGNRLASQDSMQLHRIASQDSMHSHRITSQDSMQLHRIASQYSMQQQQPSPTGSGGGSNGYNSRMNGGNGSTTADYGDTNADYGETAADYGDTVADKETGSNGKETSTDKETGANDSISSRRSITSKWNGGDLLTTVANQQQNNIPSAQQQHHQQQQQQNQQTQQQSHNGKSHFIFHIIIFL